MNYNNAEKQCDDNSTGEAPLHIIYSVRPHIRNNALE